MQPFFLLFVVISVLSFGTCSPYSIYSNDDSLSDVSDISSDESSEEEPNQALLTCLELYGGGEYEIYYKECFNLDDPLDFLRLLKFVKGLQQVSAAEMEDEDAARSRKKRFLSGLLGKMDGHYNHESKTDAKITFGEQSNGQQAANGAPSGNTVKPQL